MAWGERISYAAAAVRITGGPEITAARHGNPRIATFGSTG